MDTPTHAECIHITRYESVISYPIHNADIYNTINSYEILGINKPVVIKENYIELGKQIKTYYLKALTPCFS